MTSREWRRRWPGQVRRRQSFREGKARILVLCEGTRTEPIYVNGFKRKFRLTSLIVKSLRPNSGGLSALVKKAQLALSEDPNLDEVYCVLDHDGRENAVKSVRRQLSKLNGQRRRTTVRMVLSVPCFEYWLLLHFRMTSRSFTGILGGQSACDQVIDELRRYMPGYRKNDVRLFDECEGCIGDAIANAKSVHAVSSDGAPRSDVADLVSRLMRISSTK